MTEDRDKGHPAEESGQEAPPPPREHLEEAQKGVDVRPVYNFAPDEVPEPGGLTPADAGPGGQGEPTPGQPTSPPAESPESE